MKAFLYKRGNVNRESFDEALAYFKAQERPEAILCVGDNLDLIKIAVAWPNVPIERLTVAPPYPADDSDVVKWKWLWSCVTFQHEDIATALGSSYFTPTNINLLITNRLLYPDGSLHSYMTRYLRERVIRMFDARAKKSNARKS